jgi:hypothetical protein
MNDIIVSWTSSAFQTGMSLQIEVKVVNRSNPTVNNGSGSGISRFSVRTAALRRIEPSVMTLSNYDHGNLWLIVGDLSLKGSTGASGADLGQLLLIDLLELSCEPLESSLGPALLDGIPSETPSR